MINPVSIIAIAFIITLLGLMYYSVVSDGYETPASVSEAAIQGAKTLVGGWFGLAIANVAFHRFDLAEWNIDSFLGWAVGFLMKFLFDCYQIHKRDSAVPE